MREMPNWGSRSMRCLHTNQRKHTNVTHKNRGGERRQGMIIGDIEASCIITSIEVEEKKPLDYKHP